MLLIVFPSGCEREVYLFISICLASLSYLISPYFWRLHHFICYWSATRDPLGPVLFSLAIHSLASELVSTFNVWYLDDGTLGGSPRSVLADFATILE